MIVLNDIMYIIESKNQTEIIALIIVCEAIKLKYREFKLSSQFIQLAIAQPRYETWLLNLKFKSLYAKNECQ